MDERRINIPEYSEILGTLVKTPAGQEIRNNNQRYFPVATFEKDLQLVLNDVLSGRTLDESALREIQTVALVMKSGRAKKYSSDIFHDAIAHGITVILRNRYGFEGSEICGEGG